jgi:alginate O-acetyltransferase complex protein AlgJ
MFFFTMTTTRARITAFIFAILLLLPTLDQLLGLSVRFSSTENRNLKGMPAVNFPHVRSFVKQFDRYYKENFGWRNALFYMYSRWKFHILEQSPLPEKVVVGKDGWLYLGNSYNKVVDQHRGLQPLSADSARRIANHLLERQQELAKQGAQLYIIIAPDSHTIYPEFLPDNLQVSSEPSRLDVLKQAVSQTNLRFVDIRDTLRSAKRDHVVYYQTDTHWNEYGTLIGCATLLNRIRADQPQIPPVRLSDYYIERQKGGAGDLTTMLTLQEDQRDPIYYYIKPNPDRSARQTATIPNEAIGYPSTRFSGPGWGRLFFVGDSFSHGMMNYLPGYFHESYFMRGSKMDPTLVKAEKPTTVVIEVVERNIYQLATF